MLTTRDDSVCRAEAVRTDEMRCRFWMEIDLAVCSLQEPLDRFSVLDRVLYVKYKFIFAKIAV